MEKSNSRGRRSESSETKSTSRTTPTESVVRDEARAGSDTLTAARTPGQQARERIASGLHEAAAERAGTPAGIADTFVDERNDVLAVINELEDQLDRQQEIRESLERELTNNAAKLQDAGMRGQELEWQVVTLQTRVDALEQFRQVATTLEEELNDANARIQRLKEQLGGTEKERVRLKNELKAALKQVDELWAVRKERDSLRSDYKSVTVKLDELERNQREALEERGHLQAEIQDLQAALETVTSERHQLQMTLRTSEDRIRELVQVQEAFNDKIESLRTEKKSLQVQIAHVERENTRLVEQRQFYECEVTSLRNQNRTSEAALSSVKKAFSEVRMALTDTKVRAQRRTLDTWPRIGSTHADAQEQVLSAATADAATVMAGETDPFSTQPVTPPANAEQSAPRAEVPAGDEDQE